MNIRKISANNIKRIFLSEEKIFNNIIKENNRAAEQFVKFNFENFPKGSAQEELYNARTMLGKIAKDNNIYISFFENPKAEINMHIAGYGSNKSVSDTFSSKVNVPRKTIKYISNSENQTKDGFNQSYLRVMNFEDNFLRSVYRRIESSIRFLNNK